MGENRKNGFHTVKKADMMDYRQKIKKHRLRIFTRAVVIVVAVLAAISGACLYLALRHYEDFDIRSSMARADTTDTRFVGFCGNILKYSNDGAFYTDKNNELIWNQTYEMSDPRIDICENCLAIYDKKGTMLYILTPEGLLGSIETAMPILQVCVAEQGTVAVLMQKGSTGYLSLYDENGTSLGEGEIHGEKGGYPISIALSHDAIKLAVSMLDFNDGTVKSTVAFYNFGSVGQNVMDHCVGVKSFPEVIVPEMKFISDNRMIALADTGILIFEGSQNPQLAVEIPMEEQAKSIFYNKKYIGVVTGNTDDISNHLEIYDTKGSRIMEKDFDMDYTGIEFLKNNEICIRNENSCDIYTIRGVYKFHYVFDKELYQVLPGSSPLAYTVILKGETQNIRLK